MLELEALQVQMGLLCLGTYATREYLVTSLPEALCKLNAETVTLFALTPGVHKQLSGGVRHVWHVTAVCM